MRARSSYELQVASHTRGMGLGRRLLSECEALGEATGMQKTMLTCLKNNEQGLRFYMHNG
jgi:ribosomal protein S18 acetylase RimI-like enzyme